MNFQMGLYDFWSILHRYTQGLIHQDWTATTPSDIYLENNK